jgi:hypothetical protein
MTTKSKISLEALSAYKRAIALRSPCCEAEEHLSSLKVGYILVGKK